MNPEVFLMAEDEPSKQQPDQAGQQPHGPQTAAPPVHPQVALQPSSQPQRTSWPVLFGVGAILFGVFGTLASLPGGCAGGITTLMLPSGADNQAAASMVRSMTFWITVGSLTSAVFSVMLAIAGIGLCQRRSWSVRLLWIWSVLNIGVSVLGAVGTYTMGRRLLASFASGGSDMVYTISPADATRISVVMAIGVLVIGLSSPAFLLIWFARPTIREEVAQWP